MIIPEKIIGRNKIRDAGICILYEEWHDSDLPKTEEVADVLKRIGERFKISQRRVEQILTLNHLYIPINRARERKNRIHKLKRFLARAGNSKKDSADLLDQLRGEIDGYQPLIDNSHHIHITNLKDADLINEARKKGIAIPPEIERRLGTISK